MKSYGDLLFSTISNGLPPPATVQRINLAPDKKVMDRIPAVLQGAFIHFSIAAKAAIYLPRCKAPVFHITDGSYAYLSHFLKSGMTVVTSHDVIPLLQSQNKFSVGSPGRMAKWIIKQSLQGIKRADAVISVSHHTKGDLIREGKVNPEKIQVIHLPVSPFLLLQSQKMPRKEWIKRRKAADAYILHVGNNGFYKNREGVIRIFSKLLARTNIRLKMAGPDPGNRLKSLARNLGMSDFMDFVIDPDDRQLAELYNNASLLLFPSHYEGFGWPLLEAMVFGCPVVCSNAGSIPEVVGRAAMMSLFSNEEKMADDCFAVLNDQDLAEGLIQLGDERVRQFSFEKMESQVLAMYNALSGRCRS